MAKMKSIVPFAIVTVIMLVAGCQSDCVIPVEATSKPSFKVADTSYLPLAVGNEWQFMRPADSNKQIYYRVIGTIVKDSLAYFQIARSGVVFSRPDTMLLRFRTPDIIERWTKNYGREDYISFADTLKNQMDHRLPGKVDRTTAGLPYTVEAGTFANTTEIFFGGIEIKSTMFSRGVGFLEDSFYGGNYFQLASARLTDTVVGKQ